MIGELELVHSFLKLLYSADVRGQGAERLPWRPSKEILEDKSTSESSSFSPGQQCWGRS